MSEIKVNKISPRTACGTTTLGDSGDTFTIPAGATITNSGTATGFGATGAVNWDTSSIKATGFTAVSGNGYFCNTTSGGFTVTLPAGSAGNIIAVQDYANTFDSNGLTITPNGSEKINGGAGSVILSTEGEGLTLVYVDSTKGWRSIQDGSFAGVGSNYVAATGGTITTCGDYKIHTFTGPGTLTVTAGGSPAGSNTVEYLVVAGGGGAGASYGGGGGAGGFRFASPSISPLTYPGKPLAGPANLPVTAQGYPITVGGGGPGSTGASSGNAAKGSDSIFSTITSTGGGVGGVANPNDNTSGGSGGGGSVSGPHPNAAGSGNTPPVSPSQGNNGGAGYCGGCYGQGGGGGAIGTGGGGSGPAGGNGGAGAGMPTAFGSNGAPCGSFRYYAGGGGGGRYGPSGAGGGGGSAGVGGGGAGSTTPPGTGNAGTANTGGGGGGAGRNQPTNSAGGQGGSGIVVIRYKFQ